MSDNENAAQRSGGQIRRDRQRFTIRVRSQTIVAVQVRVPGPRRPSLALSALRPGGANGHQALLGVRNDGNVLVKGRGRLVVTDADGTDQTADYTLPITVQDTGGPADGWRLLVRATQLTSAGDTLPAPSVTSVGWACQAACTIDPANSVATPVTLPFAMPAERFFNAAASTGIGTFTVTPTVTVAVPANAHAGSYTSTVTTLLIAGP